MAVVTTLNFFGQTEAALQHYEETLGAEILFLMRFRDAPDQSLDLPDAPDLIFHATFRIEETVLMASDVGYQDSESCPEFKGFALALRYQSLDLAEEAFLALTDQGEVVIPLAESAFASWYGIVVDRFGISWKMIVNAEKE